VLITNLHELSLADLPFAQFWVTVGEIFVKKDYIFQKIKNGLIIFIFSSRFWCADFKSEKSRVISCSVLSVIRVRARVRERKGIEI
jgi:hypothetical protein